MLNSSAVVTGLVSKGSLPRREADYSYSVREGVHKVTPAVPVTVTVHRWDRYQFQRADPRATRSSHQQLLR